DNGSGQEQAERERSNLRALLSKLHAPVADERDITSILLKIVPGVDGMGHEIYAKSVKDVEEHMGAMGLELEEWELGIRRLPASVPVADERPTQEQTLPAHTDLLTYVLQDDVHNRLTPRVIDIAYTAFMQAKQPNDEDGGASDWFNDTKPVVARAIAKLRKDLMDDRAALASAPVAGEAPSDMPTPIWWINYGLHGQVTLRQDEADRARLNGATVYQYHAAPQASEAVRNAEPVAYCQPDDPINSSAFSWPGLGRKKSHTPPLYAAPQADKDDGDCAKGAGEALAWYAEQAEGCRKLGAEGDAARQALDKDGGQRARAALSPQPGAQKEQSDA
ncbi:MAG: hypothetical protein ACRER5_20405, partial [Pseudomonas sp.]